MLLSSVGGFWGGNGIVKRREERSGVEGRGSRGWWWVVVGLCGKSAIESCCHLLSLESKTLVNER